MNSGNRTSNTIRNTSVALVCQVIRTVFSFICRVVFARCLARVYLGLDGVFANVIGILSLAELGIGSALEYELFQAVAKGDDGETAAMVKYYKKIFSFISIAISGIGVIAIPLANWYVGKYGNLEGVSESITLIYLLYLANTVISYLNLDKKAIICAYQDTYIDSIAKEAIVSVQNIVQFVLLICTRNIIVYLICQVLFTFIYNQTIRIIAIKRYPAINISNPPEVSATKKRRMLENVKALFIVRLSIALVSATDNLIVTAFCGLEMTGVNSNYTVIMSCLNNFAYKIRESLTPSLGNLNAKENDEKKISILYELMFGSFWLYMLCTVGFNCLVQDVVLLCFGERYIIEYPVVVITGVNFFVLQMQVLPDMYKSTLGLFKYGRFVALTKGILNIIISILLGKVWGVFGILFATFISMVVTEVWYTPYIIFKKGLNRSPLGYYKKILLLWGEAVLIFTITYYICELFKLPLILDMCARFAVCMIVPNVIVYIFHHRTEAYSNLVGRIYLRGRRHPLL